MVGSLSLNIFPAPTIFANNTTQLSEVVHFD